MKPVWKNQPKFVEINSTRKSPDSDYPLSGVVLFSDNGKGGFFHVLFGGNTVEIIAKHMPFGISRDNPAYRLVVVKDGVYKIYCKYINRQEGAFLWEQEEKPKWFRGLKIVP